MKVAKILAVVSALAIGLLVFVLVSGNGNGTQTQVTQEEMVNVVVATADIPGNTVITDQMVAIISVAKSAKSENSLDDLTLAVGKYCTQPVYAGEQVSVKRIVDKEAMGSNAAYGLGYTVAEGMRAVSLDISYSQGVSGLLKVGNFVDIVAIMQIESNDEDLAEIGYIPTVAVTAYERVKILAVGSTVTDTDEAYGTVTFEVTPDQAAQLVYLNSGNGASNIALTLRAQTDMSVEPVEPATIYDIADLQDIYDKILEQYLGLTEGKKNNNAGNNTAE